MRALTQRRTILDRLIASHRGRIANTAGDFVLAEFCSAVDAVRCAVEAQEALAEANSGSAPDRHINFRIGIQVGDVMVKSGDRFGDGVNIAARLQTLASAGGVCVSGVAHDQVKKILPVTFSVLGAQQVKNIEEPIKAFAVSAMAGSAIATTSVPLDNVGLSRSGLGWQRTGVPSRRCRSGLLAISLGYRRRDELSASCAARACGMGGAPVRECGRVDVNTQHDVSVGLEPCSISSAIFSHSFQLGGILSPSSKSCRNAG